MANKDRSQTSITLDFGTYSEVSTGPVEAGVQGVQLHTQFCLFSK